MIWVGLVIALTRHYYGTKGIEPFLYDSVKKEKNRFSPLNSNPIIGSN